MVVVWVQVVHLDKLRRAIVHSDLRGLPKDGLVFPGAVNTGSVFVYSAVARCIITHGTNASDANVTRCAKVILLKHKLLLKTGGTNRKSPERPVGVHEGSRRIG